MVGFGLIALIRPAPFVLTKKWDLKQAIQEFVEYIKISGKFLQATRIDGNHMENNNNCGACQKAKALLK